MEPTEQNTKRSSAQTFLKTDRIDDVKIDYSEKYLTKDDVV